MTFDQTLFALIAWVVLTGIVYAHSGWRNIFNCYRSWFTRKYWTDYNIIEAASWVAKAIIIVPALVFDINIWQLYFISLVTSMSLIWASNKKLLPTLVGFNTIWVWISLMVISKHVIN